MPPTSTPTIRIATRRDLGALLRLRREYCRFEKIGFKPAAARRAVPGLLESARLGRILVLVLDGNVAGYVALGYGYSLEFGGCDGFVVELFLSRNFRGRGDGRRLLRAALTAARRDGIRAIHLESGRANRRAQRFYGALGFRPRQRFVLMSRPLAS